jgi:thiol-disulfide isomerase/thioredoxin
MKNSLAIALIAVMSGIVGFVVYRHYQAPSVEVSAPLVEVTKGPPTVLPEFSLENVEGAQQSIRSWPNKSMVINFWATWCAPCRKEIPLLNQVAAERAADGYQVVGIAIDLHDAVIKYAEKMKFEYPLLMGEKEGFAAADSFGLDAQALPMTVFTDKQARIVAFHLGELTHEKLNIIFSAVDRVNSGALSPTDARAEIALAMEKLKAS